MNKTVSLVGGAAERRAACVQSLKGLGYLVGAPLRSAAELLAGARLSRCAVVDAELPDMTPLQVLVELRRRNLPLATVFEVSADQLELAVSLMRAGAADVVVRCASPADSLLRSLQRVFSAEATHDDAQLAARARLDALSPRELEVVLLATRGLGNKDAASHLGISFRTVELHRRHAMRKLGTANIVELTHLVRSAGREDVVTNGALHPGRLTEREEEVQRLTAEGLGTKDIARRLGISVRTVETHRGNALRKLHFGGEAPPEDDGVEQLALWPAAKPVRGEGDAGARAQPLP
jgi:DNA-binding NarL/FixJ family response regulator